MSNSDIVTNVNTSSIIEITAEINNSILTHTQFTNMKELTSSMDTRLAPPYPYSEHSQIVISKGIWNELVGYI